MTETSDLKSIKGRPTDRLKSNTYSGRAEETPTGFFHWDQPVGENPTTFVGFRHDLLAKGTTEVPIKAPENSLAVLRGLYVECRQLDWLYLTGVVGPDGNPIWEGPFDANMFCPPREKGARSGEYTFPWVRLPDWCARPFDRDRPLHLTFEIQPDGHLPRPQHVAGHAYLEFAAQMPPYSRTFTGVTP